MYTRPTWDEAHMVQAIMAATRSSCLVRGVGANLVRDNRSTATGYNGAGPGITTCLETQVCFYQDLAYQDSLKGHGTYEVLKEQRKDCCCAAHAEVNAFAQCSLMGIRAEGCILYITNFPCPGCVRDHIVPNRIKEVVVWKHYLSNPLITMDELRLSQYWLGQAKIPHRMLNLTEERLKEIFALAMLVGERLPYQFVPVHKTAQE